MNSMKSILLALAFLMLPTGVFAAEKIDSFDVDIKINPDSSLEITEQILYDFGADQRHGIFREIPYKYERNNLNYNYRLEVLGVSDASGNSYDFETSAGGGKFQIKIGDPDVTVTGVQAYHITYKVEHALNYFESHDELYWNATGNDWPVPIMQASAVVHLPGQVDEGQIQVECFAGSAGATGQCSQATTQAQQANFSHAQLDPNSGLTIVVGFPKGIVTQPTRSQEIGNWLKDNFTLFLTPVGVLAMFYIWYTRGRDPKPTIPEVAQYEPPHNLTPIEAGYLMDEHNQNDEISAEIVYLATQGYLKIERVPKQGWFGKDDYKLIRVKPEDDALSQYDRMLMKTLFSLGTEEVNLSTLRKKAKLTRTSFDLQLVGKHLTKAGYYAKPPEDIRKVYVFVGIFLLVAVFSLAGLLDLGLVLTVALAGVSVLGLGYFMPRKTQRGADTAQLVKGLKQYMSVAEKDRLEFHNDPAKDPKIFEKLLPYAMALGVSKQWSKKFEDIYNGQPSWYSDPAATHFSAIHLSNNLSSFTNGFGAMVTSNSRTAGSGGSGFGGGGFSGGGGGGGGGGSW